MPATDDDTFLPFALPNIEKKKVTAAFDGGRISSDGGVSLLSATGRRTGLIDTPAAVFPDSRDPARITRSMADLLRGRVLAICRGYEDGNDLDRLRRDPAFKMACGRLPESGDGPASQPTMSRLENTPGTRALTRMSRAMLDLRCRSRRRRPRSITLDIGDTAGTAHGRQRMPLFNAHYNERRFSPVHIYDARTGHCALTVLRPGKTPGGKEVRAHIRRLARHIRQRWPRTLITIRGDSHHGRREAMDWCERNGVQYIFGFGGGKVLAEQVFPALHPCGVQRATANPGKARARTELQHAAKSWSAPRRVAARMEATRKGADVRHAVTDLTRGTPEWLCDTAYCARGQAENLIKRRKSQLASGRAGRRSPFAAGEPDAADPPCRRLLADAGGSR